jgi:hypothetical protein
MNTIWISRCKFAQLLECRRGLRRLCGEQKRQNQPHDVLGDHSRPALQSWSYGCVSAVDSTGRTIWIADAHRGDGKRFVVRADEKLTAFVELESAIRVACRWYFSCVACYSPPFHPAVHILCKKHTLIRGSDVPM